MRIASHPSTGVCFPYSLQEHFPSAFRQISQRVETVYSLSNDPHLRRGDAQGIGRLVGGHGDVYVVALDGSSGVRC